MIRFELLRSQIFSRSDEVNRPHVFESLRVDVPESLWVGIVFTTAAIAQCSRGEMGREQSRGRTEGFLLRERSQE